MLTHTSNQSEFQTSAQNMDRDSDESCCSKCVFDRLPPEMIRFIFRKLSTDDLIQQASATTDRLYRVAQHHMYLSDGALMVRGGQDTAATVVGEYDVRNVVSLYLVDVHDFDRDVPREFWRDGQEDADANEDTERRRTDALDVLHVGYAQDVRYADLVADGLHRLLSGVRAKRVCFGNVLMTIDDVEDLVSTLLEVRGCDDIPPVVRCSYDRADDVEVATLLDQVECTCAGLLAEFRVTIRRPAPRSYAIYPMSSLSAADDDCEDDDDIAAAVAAEMPEDLLTLSATDCSGLRPAAYKQLGVACRQLRRLCMRAARQVDDDGFEAVAGMPSLQHLDMGGLLNVSSDGLLNGLERASGLQSLGLGECPYVTDDVLHRVSELRRLRRLRLDLTECDKTTPAGVFDMLSGCERIQELYLTLPLNADYVEAVGRAAALGRLQLFHLTFERLSFQNHLDNLPTEDGWERKLAARFRQDVDFHVRQTFTKITVSVD